MSSFTAARIAVPPPDAVTLGEAEGELLVLLRPVSLQDGAMRRDLVAERANEATLTRFRGRIEGVEYPVVGLPATHKAEAVKSPLRGSSPSSSRSAPPASAVAASYSPLANSLLSIAHPAAYLLGLGNLFASYIPLAPSVSISSSTVPVRAIAWHPYKSRLAVALQNDAIVFYDLSAQSWSSLALQSDLQVSVSALQWAPRAGNVLAVGGARGVCAWSTVGRPISALDAHAYAAFESGNLWLDLLPSAAVASLSWSPCGRFLAACSTAQHELLVWDFAAGRSTTLLRYGGALLLRWAPNGAYLFAAGGGRFFRVWETTSWTSSRWDLSHSPVQTAAWSPDSRFLLLAERGSSSFHAIHMGTKAPPLHGAYLRMEEFPAYDADTGNGERVRVGGAIRQIEWDQTGERLAVTFEQCQLIAVYASRLAPTLEFSPRGFIRGPASQPLYISFKPQFNRGSLLATCWESGKLTFTPLYYATSAVLASDSLSQASFRVL